MANPKPTSRATAEGKAANLDRYKLGGFGSDAQAALGVKINFPNNAHQGVTITQFEFESAAKTGGLLQFDWILEVDGSPVGLIRGRHYELWQHYGRSGESTTEVLASFLDSDGKRWYYYPSLVTSKIGGAYSHRGKKLPPDFFTAPKPTKRASPEDQQHNFARYAVGDGNFDAYSQWELGTEFLSYSYEAGATIESIKPGSPAEQAGLQVGDSILEVEGAPVGIFGERTYETWKQYIYSKDGKVELLVAFEDSEGDLRYYYPTIQLAERSIQN